MQNGFTENLNDNGELEIKLNPLDYIMSRIWDSGKIQEKPFMGPFIYFDDLREVLDTILCFDNLEDV